MKRIPVLLFAVLFSAILVSCEKENLPDPEPRDEIKELILQPGPDDGQDCLVAYRETDHGYYAGENHILNPDIVASRWTYNEVYAGEGTNRTYIKFTGLDSIPEDAEVISAHLSLFGTDIGVANPLGNSYYPESPYFAYGTNESWLKRVTGEWADTTITWDNKPGTTDEYQAELPASNLRWNFDVTGIDVTNMVREMVYQGENYGFCLQLQKEEYYRSILFSSSEAEDSTKRPKLIVRYIPEKKG